MLLQTNSYVVPTDRRADHNRLMKRFRQTLLRLGCDHFEVYEQAGPAWGGTDPSGRFVQILRFADRKHQLAVQAAERNDPKAQAVIADFCDLIGFDEQQSQGLFVTGYYTGVLPVAGYRQPNQAAAEDVASEAEPAIEPPLEAAEQPVMSPAVPYADSGGVVVAETVLATAVAADEVSSFGEDSPPVAEPAVASDPLVGDVLVADDEHRSAAPPDESAPGGTGLPAMFSDDYLDDDGTSPHASPLPSDAEFDFDEHPTPHDGAASR